MAPPTLRTPASAAGNTRPDKLMVSAIAAANKISKASSRKLKGKVSNPTLKAAKPAKPGAISDTMVLTNINKDVGSTVRPSMQICENSTFCIGLGFILRQGGRF